MSMHTVSSLSVMVVIVYFYVKGLSVTLLYSNNLSLRFLDCTLKLFMTFNYHHTGDLSQT